MSNYIGEIRMFAGGFAPRGWASCDGQTLEISRNPGLFSILGTAFGGNGRTTFCLPDLRGRAPMHMGPGPGLTPRDRGAKGGRSTVTLETDAFPIHAHVPRATFRLGKTSSPRDAIWARKSGPPLYSDKAPTKPMREGVLTVAGEGAPHENRQPFLGLHYIIALEGDFPTKG